MSGKTRKAYIIFGITALSLALLFFLVMFFTGQVGDLIGYAPTAASSESSG